MDQVGSDVPFEPVSTTPLTVVVAMVFPRAAVLPAATAVVLAATAAIIGVAPMAVKQ